VDLVLYRAVDQRVRRLEGLDQRDRLDPAQLPGVEVGDADMPDARPGTLTSASVLVKRDYQFL
jgi:hypothetical protein